MEQVTARVECDEFGDQRPQLSALDGVESISNMFNFMVTVHLGNREGLTADKVLGAAAALVFEQGGTDQRKVHGVVAEFDDLLATEPDHTAYRLRIVPRLWWTSLVETTEIFMDVTLADIIATKLDALGMLADKDYKILLNDTYEPREFVVQYQESDLAFLSRQCEHWGVSYYFEHSDGRDVVVFTDHNDGFAKAGSGTAVFAPRGERTGVYALETKTTMVPSIYVQRDYNYRKPQVDLMASTQLSDGAGGGIVEYGGHFKTPDQGKRLAEIRSQEKRARRYVFHGESTVAALQGGALTSISEHPFGDVNLVLTSVSHHLRQTALGGTSDETVYENRFDAIAAKTIFRPERVTPKPRIAGVVTGVIDANQTGKYAELDEDGRYRVKFMFDPANAAAGKASRSCRMMQPHSGAGYGMHFPLRPGIEVLLSFVDGDPDRPIIAGTVPNPETASPVLAGNQERNIIRTGGGNEINFDDTDDGQRIKFTTPKSSTIFQLGAPNSPELGAALSTFGASSTVATTGNAWFGGIDTSLSAIGSLRSSGSVMSMAEPPGALAAFLAVNKIVSAVIGFASTTMKAITDIQAAIKTEKAGDVATASADAKKAADQVVGAQTALKTSKDSLDTKLTTTQKTELNALIAAYDTAQAKVGTERTKLGTLLSEKQDAGNRGLDNTKNAKIAEIGDAKKDATAATGQYKKIEDAETARDAAKAALDAKIAAYNALAAGPPPDTAKINALNDYKTKHDDLLKEQKAADDANDDKANKQRDLDDTTYQQTESDTAQGIDVAQKTLATINTVTAYISTAAALYTTVTGLLAKVVNVAQLADLSLRYGMIFPQTGLGMPTAVNLPGGVYKVTNKVASTEDTIVTGGERVFIHSPLLVLGGHKDGAMAKLAAAANPTDALKEAAATGQVLIVAAKNAMLLSNDKAEVSGTEMAYVTSQNKIELIARKLATVLPAKYEATIKMDSGASSIELQSMKTIDVIAKANDAVLTIKSETALGADTQKLVFDQTAKTISVAAKEKFLVEAPKHAKLTAADTFLLLKGEDAQMVLAKSGDWKLRIKKDSGIAMGKAETGFSAADDKTQMAFNSKNCVVFEAAGCKMRGTKIDIKATGEVKIKVGARVLLG